MRLQKFSIYLKESKKIREEYPNNFNICELLQFFPAWHRSFKRNASPLIDKQPWTTFAAIHFFEKILRKDMLVYEYGVGGSTLFFAQRVKEVISVEHDKDWSQKVTQYLKASGYKNWQICLNEPESEPDLLIEKSYSDPDSYISSEETLAGKSFKNYAQSIDKYPIKYFDLVMIDGRARPSCFKHSVDKVKRNGFLVLDNAERETYSYIHKSLDNASWKKYDFYGPGPYNFYFWQTCAWQRLD